MAAADITVDGMWATIECSDSTFTITIRDSQASLANVGAESVFLSMEGAGAIPVDGLQHNGCIELGAGDSVPMPSGTPFVRHRCAAGKTSKLWYSPVAG